MTGVPETNLFPSRTPAEDLSTDVPSGTALRPFGLTRGTALADGEAMTDLSGLTYDSERQINVDSEGDPVVADPLSPRMTTHTDTRYDMQWFVDRD
ncbi:putative ATP-grasp-modified RiPP [Actinopolyspora halophila]|uniref:putative ATP-grasp-modified RiPP n=1 Tax=Actinopolyspora halophila TaxID=1850 RepID=UPI00037F268D|nr:putative ATP-grasp-modified RiPP [Actinopolyspora halophila]